MNVLNSIIRGLWTKYPTLACAALVLGALTTLVPAKPANAQALLKLDGPLTTRNVAGPAWAKNQPIYEVNLDSYGFPKGGALRGFTEHLPVLKEMGVGLVWLMPIYPRGVLKATGSPYAVRDYRDINPDYGTPADFARLVQRAHELGLYIILDWVPDHTAWDNPLIEERPEFYLKNAKGEIRAGEKRPDVALLDYGETGRWNMALWKWMRDEMQYWTDEFDIDGFRCDMAGDVPVEFWTWLRPQLNAGRPVFLLGEADEPTLHPAFDMTYSWNLPPVLWQIVAGTKPASAIDKVLREEAESFPAGAVRMRFLDNHDWHNDPNQPGAEPKIEGADISMLQRYKGGIEPLMVLCATLPGKPLLYNGQEMSNAKAMPPLQAEARKQASHWNFYRRLFGLYQNNSALSEGSFTRIAGDKDDKVYAFVRRRGAERVLVVLNLGEAPQAATMKDASIAGTWRDVFSDSDITLEANPLFNLEAWGYKVYVTNGT